MHLPSPLRPALALGLAVLLLPGCALWRGAKEPDERATDEPRLAASDIAHEVVAEAFITPANPPDEVDSPTAWLTPEGGRWLISTGKETHQLLVHDGETGALLRRVGAKGPAPGQFNRPNGVFAWGDRLFVVERDNRRVQVLSLPGFTPLATFGEGELRSPYGLWLHEPEGGRIELWVTDSFMDGEDYDVVPPLEALSARIKRFSVLIDGDAVSARFDGASGDTSEAGALRVVESIAGDVANNRLLVAEEDVPTGTGYRVYGFDGGYAGRDIGVGEFGAQAEGIALWACPDGSGYWIAADQFIDATLFHVYDRQTLEAKGRFAGRNTGMTDGVWFSQAPSTRFPAGVFYASNRDESLSAFDWRAIASALGLRERCE
ncbi:phytase [Silanimonas sp.]|jgi:3-phytase|uniref:phytase n=1 Tax=Silanimonas sp. TaxID=1929290 RepID=UPI0037CC37EF